jgi:hypothetical protein
MTHDEPPFSKLEISGAEEVEMRPLTTTDPYAGVGAVHEPLIPNNERSNDGDGDGDGFEQNAPESSINLFVYGLTISAGVSGLLFGYDTGVISSTLVSINTDLSSRLLTSLDKGLITSSTSLFALLASPAAGILADRYGRKRVILVADALFTLGALWQAVTSTVWGMIIGRSIVGLAIGGASLIVPMYIGELVTVSIAFVTGGQVVAYSIGWLFSALPSGWRWMVGLGALPAVLQFFALMFMPETPRWLVKAEHEDEARKVLRKVFGSTSGSVDHVLRAIKNELMEEEEAKQQVKSSLSTRPCAHYRMSTAGTSTALWFQQSDVLLCHDLQSLAVFLPNSHVDEHSSHELCLHISRLLPHRQDWTPSNPLIYYPNHGSSPPALRTRFSLCPTAGIRWLKCRA